MRYTFADCLLNTDTLTLTRSGDPVTVEPQVFDLIRLLVEHADRVVTRDEMVEQVWGGRIVSDSAISARIAAARKAVGDDGKQQTVIRTIARRGLQCVAAVATDAADVPVSDKDLQPRVRYTKTDEGKMLAYSVSGDGPPLLRMGYFATNLEVEWTIPTVRTQITTLSRHHRLARYDEIGCGLSSPDMDTPDLAQKAHDLRAAADAAGFDRFALFSESGGSLVAATFAALYPERLTKMVISGGYVDGRVRRQAEAQPDAVRALIAQGWGDEQPGMARAFLLTYCPEGPLDEVERIVDMMQSAVSREVMLRQRDYVNAVSIADRLPDIRCPTLLIHARNDSVHPLSEAQKLASGIPDAELRVFDTANHLPVQDHPLFAPYLEMILAFLAE